MGAQLRPESALAAGRFPVHSWVSGTCLVQQSWTDDGPDELWRPCGTRFDGRDKRIGSPFLPNS